MGEDTIPRLCHQIVHFVQSAHQNLRRQREAEEQNTENIWPFILQEMT